MLVLSRANRYQAKAQACAMPSPDTGDKTIPDSPLLDSPIKSIKPSTSDTH
jgi:hypothetical protein